MNGEAGRKHSNDSYERRNDASRTTFEEEARAARRRLIDILNDQFGIVSYNIDSRIPISCLLQHEINSRTLPANRRLPPTDLRSNWIRSKNH
jgi:hypothetical protein